MQTLGKYKSFILLGSVLLILFVSVSVISAIWPRSEENFFELGLLGKDMKAEGYFNNASVVSLDVPQQWNIYINNQMGTDQLVLIKVKVLNSTDPLPDDRQNVWSPVKTSYVTTLPLSANQSTYIPLKWSVHDIQHTNDYDAIRSITINNSKVDVYVRSRDKRFCMVIELWVYDRVRQEFVFGWNSGKEFYSISIYMWFKT